MTAGTTTWSLYVMRFSREPLTHHVSQEYHPAGDLHTLLLMKGSPRNVVRFYMAELVRIHS